MTKRNRNKRGAKEYKKFCLPFDEIPIWLLVFAAIVLLFLIF